ncbi:thioesterase II family protein [Saccharothrix xinjiangensis]|uniref:Thioesterase II family protein n=1 Tax=Saccharothrix xinjiangensis TaxID=204798 RepID=A0ABV9Y057_9PSEU
MSPSLTVLTHRPRARWRLYCLPPGGLGPEFYLPWCPLVPTTTELCAVHLPGRGLLADQPCTTDPKALTAALTDLIDGQDDPRPFALFGHSAGALPAFTTTRRLRRTGGRPPALLALSALPAPHSGPYTQTLGALLLSGHTAANQALGLPTGAATDPARLATAYVPLLGDLLLLLQHRHQDEAPLDCDLALYGGQDDPVADLDQLTAWNDLTTTPVTPRLFPGGHTYPVDQAEALVAQLHHDLRAAADRGD